jgi:bla regulator protein BlaR1
VTGAPAFVLDLLVRSTALLLAAWAVATVLRRCGGSAAMRHYVWLAGIAGLLLLPLLSVTMPALPLAILPEASAPLASAPTAATAASTAGTGQSPSSLPQLILILYAAGAAGMLLWLFAGHRALAQIWRAAAPADAAWTDLLSKSARNLQLRSHVELRLAPGPVMPMTWGTLAPKILLPAEARHWSPTRSRFVLLHELGHVRRCDSLTLAAAALVRAIYWFHPGAWFAARQLRLEQELAADDLALGAGISPNGYARNLLELACAFCLPAPAMARRSQLEQRLAAIVRPASRDVPGFGFGTVAATLALAATWLAATAAPVVRVAASAPPVEIVVAPPAEAALPPAAAP